MESNIQEIYTEIFLIREKTQSKGPIKWYTVVNIVTATLFLESYSHVRFLLSYYKLVCSTNLKMYERTFHFLFWVCGALNYEKKWKIGKWHEYITVCSRYHFLALLVLDYTFWLNRGLMNCMSIVSFLHKNIHHTLSDKKYDIWINMCRTNSTD